MLVFLMDDSKLSNGLLKLIPAIKAKQSDEGEGPGFNVVIGSLGNKGSPCFWSTKDWRGSDKPCVLFYADGQICDVLECQLSSQPVSDLNICLNRFLLCQNKPMKVQLAIKSVEAAEDGKEYKPLDHVEHQQRDGGRQLCLRADKDAETHITLGNLGMSKHDADSTRSRVDQNECQEPKLKQAVEVTKSKVANPSPRKKCRQGQHGGGLSFEQDKETESDASKFKSLSEITTDRFADERLAAVAAAEDSISKTREGNVFQSVSSSQGLEVQRFLSGDRTFQSRSDCKQHIVAQIDTVQQSNTKQETLQQNNELLTPQQPDVLCACCNSKMKAATKFSKTDNSRLERCNDCEQRLFLRANEVEETGRARQASAEETKSGFKKHTQLEKESKKKPQPDNCESVEALIQQRAELRRRKDFGAAYIIQNKLFEMGADGYTWSQMGYPSAEQDKSLDPATWSHMGMRDKPDSALPKNKCIDGAQQQRSRGLHAPSNRSRSRRRVSGSRRRSPSVCRRSRSRGRSRTWNERNQRESRTKAHNRSRSPNPRRADSIRDHVISPQVNSNGSNWPYSPTGAADTQA